MKVMIDKQYNFSNVLVKCDGRPLRSKQNLKDEIFRLLRINHYTFDVVKRPVPPILQNYRDVDRWALRRLLQKVVDYFTWTDDVSGVVFTSNGFNYNNHCDRIVCVTASCGDSEQKALISLDSVGEFVENWFDSHVSYKPRKVVIQ